MTEPDPRDKVPEPEDKWVNVQNRMRNIPGMRSIPGMRLSLEEEWAEAWAEAWAEGLEEPPDVPIVCGADEV